MKIFFLSTDYPYPGFSGACVVNWSIVSYLVSQGHEVTLFVDPPRFGTNEIDDIFAKLRYLIVGCDCKWVVVDHLHMLVSALQEGDERRAIDNIMTELRSLVEETGVGLMLVSHLRRVAGNEGHENGVEVNLSHLRGSQSIAQISDCVIALERNQQADDPIEANTTKLRVLKSRYGKMILESLPLEAKPYEHASRIIYEAESFFGNS